jgi:membrane-bound lytic murein transglycosylase A
MLVMIGTVTAFRHPTAIAASPLVTNVPLTQLQTWPEGITWTDDQLWQGEHTAKAALLTAIHHSLTFLETPAAVVAYENYPVPGITRDRVERSLQHFQRLLLESQSPEKFYAAVQREFMLYQAVGYDGAGTVHFTGYFEPSFAASRIPTAEYRYPLYRRPPDLENWELPHPTRLDLEGIDGLQGHQGLLQGLELVWMRDRLEAFLVQVQGSAQLQLTDGTTFSVSYAGRTEHSYTSIGRELIQDGKVSPEGMTLRRLLDYFAAYPEALNVYLPRNDRFIFFRESDGGPPTGTFSVPVTPGRSIATDKALMPPGAIALLTLDMPQRSASGAWETQAISRFVLNQDTGGAIQGAGRVDLFVGTGVAAGETAGQINTDGALFYLLLPP